MVSNRSMVELNDLSPDDLRALHRDHEARLEELRRKARLSPEEEIEQKTLKKKKLLLKDRLEALRRKAS